MNQWEILTWDFADAGPHPAVRVSAPERVATKPLVNVLLCSSARAGREPAPYEALLGQPDGLDWPTLCRCDLLYLAPSQHSC